MKNKTLFDDFDEVSAKAWKQKIQYDLKGADYNEALVWESPEGIKVKPFYHADDLEEREIYSHPINDKWRIGQAIYAGNATMANEKALHNLKRGIESIVFIIPSETTSIKTLFKNINLDEVTIYLDLQFLSPSYIQSIVDFASKSEKRIFFNVDIIGNLARSGNWYFNLKKDHELLDILVTSKIHNLLSVDVSLYQNAGANLVQQLGYAMAHANEYLNHFQEKKQLSQLKSITFKVAVGGNYFFEIAKLRALRLLWESLTLEYGVVITCHILAVPSKRNKTLYDYNVNMLRTTTECMSAVLGTANTVVNMSYDAIYHKDNDFAERLALNQLLILKEESYFDKVANASDGSYYIETLTKQLAEKGLELLKSIEKEGGFLKLLKAHTIQGKIKESASKEQQLFNEQKEVLVGTNKFQNENDKMKDDLELHPFVKINPRKTLLEPIIEKRLAEELEQERLNDE